MIEPLATLAAHSDALGWVVVAAFLAGALAEYADRDLARYVASGAWALFGLFWLAVFPHFLFEVKSPVEGIGSLLAVPACLYAAYLLVRGRESLLVLTRAVAFMGILYYPPQAIPAVRRALIQAVTHQTRWVIHLLGYHPEFVQGPGYGYRNMFVFPSFKTYITYACTGMGSIAVFGGLTAACDAPLRRKVRSFGIAVGIIWLLNIARNSLVAIAAGKAWFSQDAVIWFGATVANVPADRAVFWFPHTVLAQLLAVVALVGITWIVVHELPEILSILEEALYVLTGTDLDLREELGISPVRADGGDAER